MKARLFAALMCVAIPASIALADDTEANGPFITAGQVDFLFNFNGFNAGTFLQNGVGVKFFISDAVAIRGALQFATVSETIPYEGDGAGVNGSESATLMGITGGLEYHFTQTRISPYIGGEVNFNRTSTSFTDAAANTAGQTTTSDPVTVPVQINDSTWYGGLTLGVGGMAGVEFFIAKGVSLGVEYRLGWVLNSMFNQTSPNVPAPGNISRFDISSGGGLTLGISL
jgi:opacity protein-like surface antigen